MVTESQRINNLKKLLARGKMSPKLKTATQKLIVALKKGNRTQINELSYLHQHISGSMSAREYPYREDDDYNKKVVGTTVYYEFDMIWHGDY